MQTKSWDPQDKGEDKLSQSEARMMTDLANDPYDDDEITNWLIAWYLFDSKTYKNTF